MERPQRKRLRLESYDYSQPGYYFITICTKERHQNILCSLDLVGAPSPAARRYLCRARTARRTQFHHPATPGWRLPPSGKS